MAFLEFSKNYFHILMAPVTMLSIPVWPAIFSLTLSEALVLPN